MNLSRCFIPRILLLMVLFGALFSSCRNSKDLVYLKNAQNKEIIPVLSDSITQYLIKPGDILYVSIKSMNNDVNMVFNPESNMEQNTGTSYQKYTTPQGAYLYGFEVDAQGNLNLPFIGKVYVAGNNQQKAQLLVQAKADKYLKDAIVKVKLLNYKVTVLGEVNSPGVYYNYNNNFTLLEAIGMANGNTDYANIKKVLVIRPKAEGQQVIKLDLSNKNIWESPAFYLHPNDYVYVEPASNKNVQLNSKAYSVILSSLSVILGVLGLIF